MLQKQRTAPLPWQSSRFPQCTLHLDKRTQPKETEFRQQLIIFCASNYYLSCATDGDLEFDCVGASRPPARPPARAPAHRTDCSSPSPNACKKCVMRVVYFFLLQEKPFTAGSGRDGHTSPLAAAAFPAPSYWLLFRLFVNTSKWRRV